VGGVVKLACRSLNAMFQPAAINQREFFHELAAHHSGIGPVCGR
jgi:hypothetical protein